MLRFTINSESERVALCQALTASVQTINADILKSVKEMSDDLDGGGKQYWTEKLMDLSIDLKVTQQVLDRAKVAQKIEETLEEDL
jgi:hypothetical protein|tara:strand:- start:897 stop:1151 length:255 start_codon:yes stop_codon:yes gene_type:complete